MIDRDTAENRLLRIIEKSTPYGEQDGGFIAYYIIPTGPIHRAILYLQQHGHSVPNPPQDVETRPLVADPDTLVIQRDENGEWPEAAMLIIKAMTPEFKAKLIEDDIGAIVLDALLEGQPK